MNMIQSFGIKIHWTLLILISIIILLFGYGCRRDTCMLVEIADPDLTNNFTPLTSTDVEVGQAFGLRNRTENLLDRNACETMASIATATRMTVEYRLDNFSSYETVFDDNFDIEGITAGEFLNKEYNYLFADPGQYRITTEADGIERILERDESNNKYSDAARGTNKRDLPELEVSLTVRPNPDFDREKAGFAPGEKVKVFEKE